MATQEELRLLTPTLTEVILERGVGLPHPRKTVKAMWQRLYATYKKSPIAMSFLNEMRAGPLVPILGPDQRILDGVKDGMPIFGYVNQGRVYVPAQADPETLIHEFRHVQQRRKIGPSFYDDQRTRACSRGWYLMSNLLEADATTFESIAAGYPESRFCDIFNDRAQYVRPYVERRLKHIFLSSASDLGKKPATFKPNEEALTYIILSRACILPDGRNYLFNGKSEGERWHFARELTHQILPPPFKEKPARRWFHLGWPSLSSARNTPEGFSQ